MKRFILVTLCLISFSSFAQEKTTNANYIEINAEAERKVTPDEIYIYINIEERYDGKDKTTIESQEKKLKKALREKNIDLEHFKLLDAMSEYQKVKWHGKKDALASTEYSLMVSTAGQAKVVFEVLADLELEKSRIYKTEYSKEDALKKELRIEAMKKGKEQANYMLEAIGEKTGKPMIIREQNHYIQREVAYDLNPLRYSSNNGLAYNDPYQGNDSMQFNDITFKTTIYLKFEIAE